MITFECTQCHEICTEKYPEQWGYYKNEFGCQRCFDIYNGPEDSYYEGMAESNVRYEMSQYSQLQNAGRV
jgi:hypothetical protein